MKFATKIVSVVMALVIFCTMVTPVMAADSKVDTHAEYVDMVAEETGAPALTSAEFIQKWNAVGDFFRVMTGDRFPSEEKMEVAFDDYLVSMNFYIVESSGLDIIALAQGLPKITTPADLIGEKVELDTAKMRSILYQLRDKAAAEGDTDTAELYGFLGAFVSTVEKMYFYTVPTENPAVYELYLEVTYKDGGKDSTGTNLLIDTESGEIYGRKGNGILGIGFNFNVKEMMVYALINAWHRDMGYAVLYDKAAEALPVWNIITRRFCFDYNGLEWMIQAWKGNYILISNGAEVGVYNRVPGEEMGTFYNCATDEQLMTMTMKLSTVNGTTLLDLKPQKHWWINGFKLNGYTYEPESLVLEFSIEMPDMEMVNAFTAAIETEENGDVSYSVSGTTVYCKW